MSQQHNLTNLENTHNMLDVVKWSDSILGGNYFASFVLISVFFVIFVYLISRGQQTAQAVAAGMWICGILAMFFRFADIISGYYFMVVIVLMALSAGWLYLTNTSS